MQGPVALEKSRLWENVLGYKNFILKKIDNDNRIMQHMTTMMTSVSWGEYKLEFNIKKKTTSSSIINFYSMLKQIFSQIFFMLEF